MLKNKLEDLEICALTMIGRAIIHYDSTFLSRVLELYKVIANKAEVLSRQ